MSRQAEADYPVADIRRLVDYLYDDEARHCEEMEGADVSFDADHIFHAVKAVADWLGQLSAR